MITISASFGAGGSWVAPRVAERLGSRFIDRAIPVGVAEQLAVPLEHALAHDESAAAPGLARLAVALAAPSGVRMPEPTDDAFCREAERVIIEAGAAAGTVVVLGRAGALVLRDRSDALHVRLDGPAEARVRQAMRIENVSERDARRRLRDSDRARTAYVKHFYSADPRDPDHYHLMLNSTKLPFETCVEVILQAARALPQP